MRVAKDEGDSDPRDIAKPRGKFQSHSIETPSPTIESWSKWSWNCCRASIECTNLEGLIWDNNLVLAFTNDRDNPRFSEPYFRNSPDQLKV